VAIPSSLVGAVTEPFHHAVDARWLMAYAAGLGDANPRYLDTLAEGGIVGHPLFPVCPEWPVVLAVRDLARQAGTPLEELRRGVHATHDLHIHRLVRPGDELTTIATVTAVQARPPGAYLVTRLDTTDGDGQPVATTWQEDLYLRTAVDGADREAEPAPEPPPGPEADEVAVETKVPVAAGAAHVYTECARIWNPIHTDPTAAQQAGLPAIILHGTATHALAISEAVNRWAGGDPARVRRVTARFGGMVLLPSTLTVATIHDGGAVVDLVVRNEAGEAAVRDARLVLAPA
jgi:acyl dehydratase